MIVNETGQFYPPAPACAGCRAYRLDDPFRDLRDGKHVREVALVDRERRHDRRPAEPALLKAGRKHAFLDVRKVLALVVLLALRNDQFLIRHLSNDGTDLAADLLNGSQTAMAERDLIPASYLGMWPNHDRVELAVCLDLLTQAFQSSGAISMRSATKDGSIRSGSSSTIVCPAVSQRSISSARFARSDISLNDLPTAPTGCAIWDQASGPMSGRVRLGGWAETAGFGASDAAAGGNDVNRAFRLKPPSPMPS